MIVFYNSLKEYETCAYRFSKLFLNQDSSNAFQDQRFLCDTVASRFLLHWASRKFSPKIDSNWVLSLYEEEIGQRNIVGFDKSDLELIKRRILNQSEQIIETIKYHALDRSHHFLVNKKYKKKLGKSEHFISGNISLVSGTGKWLLELDFTAEPGKWDRNILIFSGLLISLVTKKLPSRLSLILPSMVRPEERLRDIPLEKKDFADMFERVRSFIKNCEDNNFPANGAWTECKYCSVKKNCHRYAS